MALRSFAMLKSLRLQGAIAGGLGGVLGWGLAELIIMRSYYGTASVGGVFAHVTAFGAIVGPCIGLLLGTAEGIILGSRHRLLQGAGLGLLLGLVGGALGGFLAQAAYMATCYLPFVGRGIGWAVLGAGIGVTQGIRRRSRRGLRSATLGGAIGGGLGGVMFDVVGLAVSDDVASRAIALIILGACIGLWIVIMEQVMATGVLKVLSGRAEGRDFVLDKPRLTMGRDERSDVPLFGDPQVMPQHAILTASPGGYEIEPVGGAPVTVGGAPVYGRQLLQHEQIVTLGATRLIYRLRKAPSGSAQPVAPQHPGLPPKNLPVPPPAAQHPSLPPKDWPAPPPAASTCPYCGSSLRPQARFCGRCGRTLPGR